MSKINLSILNTEGNNANTRDIDRLSTEEMLQKINDEDKTVAYVVEKQIPQITKLVDAVHDALVEGGRLIYIGAGTSGRLGVLDASECPPTYGVSHELVQGIIAGGKDAMFKAQEGAEDSVDGAINDLKHLDLSYKDVVIGLAASGRTPYVISGLQYANSIGATTGSISCVERSQVSAVAQYAVEVVTGAEVITGSTRMKAGTAQKLVLNMISTALMIKLGKVYHNYMVDVQPTNEKLVIRAINMIKTLVECDDITAKELFEASGRSVKIALIMHLTNVDRQTAVTLLSANNNRVAQVINR